MLETIGVWLVVLAVVFAVGNLWFHAAESILDRIRRLLTRHREPPPWHPLAPEAEDSGEKESDRPR